MHASLKPVEGACMGGTLMFQKWQRGEGERGRTSASHSCLMSVQTALHATASASAVVPWPPLVEMRRSSSTSSASRAAAGSTMS